MFKFTPSNGDKKTILNLANKSIASELDDFWWRDKAINEIFEKGEVEEINIANNCIDEWDDFIKKIEKIKWN